MTVVNELADAIHLLAELVRDTRELADAVEDGQKFLAHEHPEAKRDLAEVLSQMQTTVEGLAGVTSVVTGFRFTTTGAAVDFEPRRFNTYVIAQKEKVAGLRGNIGNLKGSCEKDPRSSGQAERAGWGQKRLDSDVPPIRQQSTHHEH